MKTRLIVSSIALIITSVFIGFAIYQDIAEHSETQAFIYLNSDHKVYCDKAVFFEASEIALKEEGCK